MRGGCPLGCPPPLPSATLAEPGPRSQPGDAEGVEEGSIGKVMGVGARMGATPATTPVQSAVRLWKIGAASGSVDLCEWSLGSRWVSGSMRVVVRITMGQRIYASGR